MTTLGRLKLSIAVLGFGTALVFAPSSRAQSEIAPDHFDGNEPWAVATVQAPAPKVSPSSPAATLASARNGAASLHTTTHLAPASAPSASRRPEVVAVEDKRKTSVGKPNHQ